LVFSITHVFLTFCKKYTLLITSKLSGKIRKVIKSVKRAKKKNG
jgi:hypothetical protein